MATLDHFIILLTPEQVIKASASLQDSDGVDHANNAETTNLLNEQFVIAFTNANGVISEHEHSGVKIEYAFESFCFRPANVIKVVNKLKSKDSSGPDNMQASFFKNASSALLTICHVFLMLVYLHQICH